MTRPIIIDTDPGIDDAVAIFMALASPDLDVVGLTTVYGNAGIDVTTRNALALLEIADRSNIAVAKGAAKPIASDYLGPAAFVHGEHGLGKTRVNDPKTSPIEADAAEFIYTQALANPGELTLIPIGPLTNLAIALDRYPDLPELIEEVVIMGGNALVPGNATPTAEANINNDPEAADLVFGANWSVTMIGLDVTHDIIMDHACMDRVTGTGTAQAALLDGALSFYREFVEQVAGIEGIFMHDPATIAYVLNPELFTTVTSPIRVETESFSRGKTWPLLRPTDMAPEAWQGRPNVNICTAVDAARVMKLIEGLLIP
jgi:inosine-uridine nucleoside N-ribohydrolase